VCKKMKLLRLARYLIKPIFLLFLLTLGVSVLAQSDAEKQQRIEAMVNDFSSEFNVPEIDVFAVKKLLLDKKRVIVDVRTAKERQVSMIPTAITQDQFEKNSEAYRQENIVVYCTIGYRSSQYVKRWNKQGFHMRNLRGSLLLWTHAGGDLVDSEGKPTRQVHVLGKKWNLVPSSYQGRY
jgi:rhodanese-related sulfurtransferase